MCSDEQKSPAEDAPLAEPPVEAKSEDVENEARSSCFRSDHKHRPLFLVVFMAITLLVIVSGVIPFFINPEAVPANQTEYINQTAVTDVDAYPLLDETLQQRLVSINTSGVDEDTPKTPRVGLGLVKALMSRRDSGSKPPTPSDCLRTYRAAQPNLVGGPSDAEITVDECARRHQRRQRRRRQKTKGKRRHRRRKGQGQRPDEIQEVKLAGDPFKNDKGWLDSIASNATKELRRSGSRKLLKSGRSRPGASRLKQLWLESEMFRDWKRQRSHDSLLKLPTAQLAISELWQQLFRQGDHWKTIYKEMHHGAEPMNETVHLTKHDMDGMPDHRTHTIITEVLQ